MKLPTHYNNWFNFGFNNDNTKTKRSSRLDKFFIKFEKIDQSSVIPVREAFYLNNHRINELANGSEIHVMLSGGYDSQSIAKTMIEDNVKFTALIMDFGRNINFYDVESAKNFCEKYSIPHKIVSFDLIDFFKSGEYNDYTEQTHCNSQIIYSYMRGMRDVKGIVITGHGDQEFIFENNKKFWRFHEQNFCLFEYAKSINLDGFIRYHEFSKELWYSCYHHYWSNLNSDDKTKSYEIKINLFSEVGLEYRPKYTGFEPYHYPNTEYQDLRRQMHSILISKFPSSENDIQNLYDKKSTGDIFFIETPY